jgi:hypothetical protein
MAAGLLDGRSKTKSKIHVKSKNIFFLAPGSPWDHIFPDSFDTYSTMSCCTDMIRVVPCTHGAHISMREANAHPILIEFDILTVGRTRFKLTRWVVCSDDWGNW